MWFTVRLHTAPNVPVNFVSWYEAAQFVNWLNTSTGHHPAYRFTGTQGVLIDGMTSDYAFDVWSASEAYEGTNLYRHKDAFYYMPTRSEWHKAAYWNGVERQDYATKTGGDPYQGDGLTGTGWNYRDGEYATDPAGPWDVGSGSEELNGTFDMMGNVWEWAESPFSSFVAYAADGSRGLRGGSYHSDYGTWPLSRGYNHYDGGYSFPYYERNDIGFRVAAEVPEPASAALLAVGSLATFGRWRRRI